MSVVISRSTIARLPRLIADMDVRRAARDAADTAATQAAGVSRSSHKKARNAASTARRQAATRGRGLRTLRLTTEPRRSEPDAPMLVAVLLGFLAGLSVMYLLQRRAAARRRARQAAIEDRLADMTPSDDAAAEVPAEVPDDGAPAAGAGPELVGVMGQESPEAVAERTEIPA